MNHNLRDSILSGYLYSYISPGGSSVFTGPIGVRVYYDAQLELGNTPEDIMSTIVRHEDLDIPVEKIDILSSKYPLEVKLPRPPKFYTTHIPKHYNTWHL